MSKVGSWSTTPGSNNSTPPDGWPEGQAPSTVNDCAREMMASIRTLINDIQYIDQNFTPTFINTTSFSVAGDQTSAIHAGRRLKIYDATAGVATVIYATVVTASFTAVTTISVSADGGQLTSSLSSFAISILSNTNDSLPRKLAASYSAVTTDNLTINGTTTASGAVSLLTTLSVSGATALNSTLTVSGATSLLTTLSVSGAAVIKATLSVGGAVNLASTLTVGGALAVVGAVRCDSTLSVSGTVVAANVAKAWVRFVASAGGAPGINSSFNIASVSRSAAGIYRVNFTNAFVDNIYAYSLSITGGGTGTQSESYTASTLKFAIVDHAGSVREGVVVNFVGYR